MIITLSQREVVLGCFLVFTTLAMIWLRRSFFVAKNRWHRSKNLDTPLRRSSFSIVYEIDTHSLRVEYKSLRYRKEVYILWWCYLSKWCYSRLIKIMGSNFMQLHLHNYSSSSWETKFLQRKKSFCHSDIKHVYKSKDKH